MTPKLSVWLIIALAGLAAGCGGSSSSTSSSQTTTSATTTSSGATAATGAAKEPSDPRKVAACKRGVPEPPAISASAAEKIRAICEGAGSGDPAARHKVAQEVCTELIYAFKVPAGETQTRLLLVCKTK